MGTMFVPSRTLRLTLKAANGDICFYDRDWSWKSCYGNKIKGVILFLLWCTFVVPSFKNTALIFPEIFFIQYFTIFQLQMLWRYHWKMSIPLKRKTIFQKETLFFCISKCLSNKQKNIFHVIYTLRKEYKLLY